MIFCHGCPYPVGHRYTIHGTEMPGPMVIPPESVVAEMTDGWTVTYHLHDNKEEDVTVDINAAVRAAMVENRTELFKAVERRIEPMLADVQAEFRITGDISPGESLTVEAAIQAFCQAMTDWMIVSLHDEIQAEVTSSLGVERVYARRVEGDCWQVLTFDECEVLGLDGTGRDQ